MKKYWNYFKYVLEHKKNVFIECWKEKLYVHAFTHDMSKFRPSEFIAYAKKVDGGFSSKKPRHIETAFDTAWCHHQNRNKHHWDYWCLFNGQPVYMDEKYIKQMVCDWRAMAKIVNETALDFYTKNRDKIKMDMVSQVLLEGLIGYINE